MEGMLLFKDSDLYINGTYCGHSIKDDLVPLLLVYCSSGSICSFFCAFAILAMIFCRLFTLLTHRLIIYMLGGMLFYSIVVAIQFINLRLNIWEGKHTTLCVIESVFIHYSVWVMLLSILMVTLHLTVMVLFPSCYLDITKLEPFYALFPWIFPLLIAWIPFIHGNYGIAGPMCWIRQYNDDCTLNKEGVILMFALWFGEEFIALILNNIALVVVIILMCKRAYQKTMSQDYSKALKQTLPLLVYPIMLESFSWFAIASVSYQSIHEGRSVRWLSFAHASWGFSAPVFILVYFLLLHKTIRKNIKKWRCLKCCWKKKHVIFKDEEPKATDRLSDLSDRLTLYGTTVTCPTTAHIPRESEVEKEYEKMIR